MNVALNKLRLGLLVAAVTTTNALAQKVSVGYDKSVEFSKYASCHMGEPALPSQAAAALCEHCRLH
jgi:hypothetical protein